MRVRNHKLVGDDGLNVPYNETPNKSAGTINPEYIVMHYTASGTLSGTVAWFKNPNAQASAHLVIGHDGAIVQMGRFNQKLWHAGTSRLGTRSGFNGFAIGIEIVNWGLLYGQPGQWRSWTGAPIDDSRVIQATHKMDTSSAGWEQFQEIQIDVAVSAVQAICAEYGIGESHVVGHDDISGFRGKRDPGPLLNLERFRSRVFGRADDGDAQSGLFKVSASSGLNMRVGAGVQFAVKKSLPIGTKVALLQTDQVWWLVSEIDQNGNEGETGWVHSRWLSPA